MNQLSLFPFLVIASSYVLMPRAVSAQSTLVNIETVLVGDAGNAPQDEFSRRGAVDYDFRIGKFEITIE